MSDEEGGGVGAAGEAEFVEDVAEVVFHGLVAEAEDGGDFLVGFAFGDEGENGMFARGEPIEFAFFGSLDGAVGAAEHLGDGGVEHGLAGGDVDDGLGECFAVDFLEKVRVGTGRHGVEDGVFVGVRREDDDTNAPAEFLDFTAGSEAAFPAEADVEEDDIREASDGAFDGFVDGACFAHNFEVREAFEHASETDADHDMVVDDQDANSGGCLGLSCCFGAGGEERRHGIREVFRERFGCLDPGASGW